MKFVCYTIPGQFNDFQIPFLKQRFGSRGKLVHLAESREIAIATVKTAMSRTARYGKLLRKIECTRPEVLEVLIAHKMKYWSLRAQHPTCFSNCRPSRARRNFLRLLAKYPQIGKCLSLTVLSAYPPL